ncbi:MAG: hypothetical protein NTY20_04885 [Candidatus Aenigmarchaeota archaeon]|nr:hypothetical protein [Candidatus Aenigmarchaeota archaeon]
MVEFPTNFLDPQAIFNFANTQSAGSWLFLGINTIVSAIVGGILLIFLVEVFSHKFGESIKPQNAFLVTLIASAITNFGILGLLAGLVSAVPSVSIILMALPLLVWFVLIKAFFSEMNILHAFLVAVIFFMLNMLVIPYIVSMVAGFIPIGLA